MCKEINVNKYTIKNYTILKCYVRDRVSYDGSNKDVFIQTNYILLTLVCENLIFLLLYFKFQVYIS